MANISRTLVETEVDSIDVAVVTDIYKTKTRRNGPMQANNVFLHLQVIPAGPFWFFLQTGILISMSNIHLKLIPLRFLF